MFDSVKKKQSNDTSEREIGEHDFMDSLGNVIDKRKDREKRAFKEITEQYNDWESFSEIVLNRLIQKKAGKLYQDERIEDLKKKKALRTIQTLRTKKEIKDAIRSGKNVLKQKVKPSKKIRVTYALIFDRKRWRFETTPYTYDALETEGRILTTFRRYPYTFPSKVAAYLLPNDLEVGERVILEDLIEDIVGASHSEGTYRLDSTEAIWNGEKFEVDCRSYDVKITIG